jgi:transcriptional regulator with XRE-family HTH domain
MNVVGPFVRRLRLRAGLSQPAFAAKCQMAGWDISRDIVARIEGGVRCVEDREILKLAEVLECSVQNLFPK